VARSPISRDAFVGLYIHHHLARIYLLLGEPENALDQREPRSKCPPGWLKVDATSRFGNPRLEG
jgi:hypothetical protein